MKNIGLLACKSALSITNHLCYALKKQDENHQFNFIPLNSEEMVFPNQEIKTVIQEYIALEELYIVQQFDDPESKQSVNDNIIALCTAIDAAYRNGYSKISLILTQFPYSRQERRTAREGISAQVMAKIFENFVIKKIFCFDLHHPAIEGFFSKIQVIHLSLLGIFIDYIKIHCKEIENYTVIAADIGAMKTIQKIAELLNTAYLVLNKTRNFLDASKTIEKLEILLGDVKNIQKVIIFDDMIATANTLIKTCEFIKSMSKVEEIVIFTSFAFFNGHAIEKLEEAFQKNLFHKIIGTNLVYRSEASLKKIHWYEQIDVSPFIASEIIKHLKV